jgi:hypothetical protein
MMAYAYLHGLPELLPHIVNEKGTPHVADWLRRIIERPAVVDALALRSSSIAPTMYAAPGT